VRLFGCCSFYCGLTAALIAMDSLVTPTVPERQGGGSCNLLFSNVKELSQARCAVYVLKR
jgi:hypothetical protein